MADMNVNSVASASVSALQGSVSAAKGSSASTGSESASSTVKVVVSRYTTTSITGKVTTVTTYSDGSVTTTVTEGDTVILKSTKQPALAG